jgi:hypothetical protein
MTSRMSAPCFPSRFRFRGSHLVVRRHGQHASHNHRATQRGIRRPLTQIAPFSRALPRRACLMKSPRHGRLGARSASWSSVRNYKRQSVYSGVSAPERPEGQATSDDVRHSSSKRRVDSATRTVKREIEANAHDHAGYDARRGDSRGLRTDISARSRSVCPRVPVDTASDVRRPVCHRWR